jgi:hypothetical protein
MRLLQQAGKLCCGETALACRQVIEGPRWVAALHEFKGMGQQGVRLHETLAAHRDGLVFFSFSFCSCDSCIVRAVTAAMA